MKKEEIKEILDNFKNNYDELGSCYYPEDILGSEDLKLLYDYITNLQEENKQLKELCDKYEEEHNNEFQCWKRDIKELLDKRDRINKAIEYIETLEKQEAYKIEDNENGVPELKVNNEEYLVLCKYNKLLNILKGDNK